MIYIFVRDMANLVINCICLFQIGLLLFESLLLLSYFSLFHYENQAVLRWGKSPTILHKVIDTNVLL